MTTEPVILSYASPVDNCRVPGLRPLLYLSILFAVTQLLDTLLWWQWHSLPDFPTAAFGAIEWTWQYDDIWRFFIAPLIPLLLAAFAVAAFLALFRPSAKTLRFLRITTWLLLTVFILDQMEKAVVEYHDSIEAIWQPRPPTFGNFIYAFYNMLEFIALPLALLMILHNHRHPSPIHANMGLVRSLCALTLIYAILAFVGPCLEHTIWAARIHKVFNFRSLTKFHELYHLAYWAILTFLSLPLGLAALATRWFSPAGRKILLVSAWAIIVVQIFYNLENIVMVFIGYLGWTPQFSNTGKNFETIRWLEDFCHYITLQTAFPLVLIYLLSCRQVREVFAERQS